MAVNKVVYDGETLVDLTGDNVSESTLLSGATAHNAAGETIVGTVVVPTKVSLLENDSGFVTTTALNAKVDKVEGKGLSTNDYTTLEKKKLASIEDGANKTIIDSALSSTSENAVQNKVVNAKFNEINNKITEINVSLNDSIQIVNEPISFPSADFNGYITGLSFGGGNFIVFSDTECASFGANINSWTGTTMPASNFKSAAYGDGKFVAISNTKIAYSTDGGYRWNEVEGLPSIVNSFAVVGYGAGKFIILTNNGKCFYSTDCTTWEQWTEVLLPISDLVWDSITYGNGKFVAIAHNTNTALYSIDGITWQTSTLPHSGYWSSVAYGGGKFVAIDRNSTTAAYSEDGINWSTSTIPNMYYSIAYGDGKFVITSGSFPATPVYSYDGINWLTSSSYDIEGNLVEAYGDYLAYGNNQFIAVGGHSGNYIISYSKDGIKWCKTNLGLTTNNAGASVDLGLKEYLTGNKQDKITGTAGQFVVIGDDGNVTTKTIPSAEEASF